MKRTIVFAAFATVAFAVFAQQGGGRGAFLGQQAYDEVRRMSAQVDVLQNNIDDISSRLSRLERGNGGGEVAALQSRIAALERTVSELRSQLQSQRGEIVADLSRRIAKLPQNQPAPPPKPVVTTKVIRGPHREYVVKSGDTLSLVAEAFGTKVSVLRELNGLKGNVLRVGQKLIVPAK